ncbi:MULTISPECIES: PEP/pyruvate-binding domain-containing protein [Priestia]|uniref:PEP/pyruvate-binding domain-containing protein n=1 Tax=Priestia TaxID=2800373 RepID=UPI0027A98946|nr:PEP/pyruvate-binding domain-containing protein [Priestia megaterium]WDC89996.1 PEP/pyruvate-binding domain-containing protein [Priestia megaterium]
MYSLSFQKVDGANERVGAKALNLIKMKRKNLPIPDGFVIQTEALKRYIEWNGIDRQTDNIHERILHGEIPIEIESDLIEAFRNLKCSYTSVAVRSSSSAEDLEGASFAGQYETYLNVKSTEDFLSKVKACWASFFTERVEQYTQNMYANFDEISMAVVVQGLIQSEVSGVIFSQNPVNHNTKEMMINASYGLGEAIVSGLVTPDVYLVNKQTFKIEKEKGLKEVKIIPLAEGVEEIETTEDEQQRFCLTDEKIIELAEITKEVEALYQHPVDIEFGVQDNQVYLLQARAITTLTEAKELTPFQKDISLSFDDMEEFWILNDTSFSHAVSPLYASFIIPAFSEGTAASFKKLKFMFNRLNLKLYKGHIYTKMEPFKGDSNKRFQENKELMESIYPILTKRMNQIITEQFLPYYNKLNSFTYENLTLQRGKEILQSLADFYKTAYDLHFDIVMPQMSLNTIVEEYYKNLTNKKSGHDVYELLTGKMNKSLETDQQLSRLALTVKRDSELTEIFQEECTETLLKKLEGNKAAKSFMAEVDTFLKQYGYRNVVSHDFVGETWLENPLHALSIIQGYVKDNYNFDENFKQTVKKREQNYNEFLEQIADSKHKEEFKKYYQWALDASVIRDDHHFYIDAMLDAKARLFLLKLGNLLVHHHVFLVEEDVFFLYLDELESLLENPADMTKLIEKRKKEHAEHEQTSNLPRYFGVPEAAQLKEAEKYMGAIEEDDANSEHCIKGLASSSGIYTGKVTVISNTKDFSKLEKGDVLVCKTTTPLWTTLFQTAGAVITDAGGILSHSAIIAREYEIPAVVGTKISTDKLKDGDMVMVDGTNGIVTLLND